MLASIAGQNLGREPETSPPGRPTAVFVCYDLPYRSCWPLLQRQECFVNRLLKNADCGLFKNVQMRGAREIDERRSIYRYVEARGSSATKQVGLFQQPVFKIGRASCRE